MKNDIRQQYRLLVKTFTRQVGEIFITQGATLKVVDALSPSCAGCYFFDYDTDKCSKHNDKTGACAPPHRTDEKHVIFRQLTAKTKNDLRRIETTAPLAVLAHFKRATSLCRNIQAQPRRLPQD